MSLIVGLAVLLVGFVVTALPSGFQSDGQPTTRAMAGNADYGTQRLPMALVRRAGLAAMVAGSVLVLMSVL